MPAGIIVTFSLVPSHCILHPQTLPSHKEKRSSEPSQISWHFCDSDSVT